MTRPGSACESRVPRAFPRFMGDFKIPTLYLTVWMHIIVSIGNCETGSGYDPK